MSHAEPSLDIEKLDIIQKFWISDTDEDVYIISSKLSNVDADFS